MQQPFPNSDFDELIKAPIGGRGNLAGEIPLDDQLLTFENQDLSSFSFGDEYYATGTAVEVPQEAIGKESTGKLFQ